MGWLLWQRKDGLSVISHQSSVVSHQSSVVSHQSSVISRQSQSAHAEGNANP